MTAPETPPRKSKSHRWLWLFAALLPMALFGVIREKQSWRPQVTYLSQEQKASFKRSRSIEVPKSLPTIKDWPARRSKFDVHRENIAVTAEELPNSSTANEYAYNTKIKFFNVKKRRLMHKHFKKGLILRQISFSQDAILLYALFIGIGTNPLQCWRVTDGKSVFQLNLPEQFGHFKISPNEQNIVFWKSPRDNNTLSLWNLKMKKFTKLFVNPTPISTDPRFFYLNGSSEAVGFSTDGNYLLVYGEQNTFTSHRIK